MNEVTVTETRTHGWVASDGRKWGTAADAERAIRAAAPPGVLLVHWQPYTPIGRMAVRAVTATETNGTHRGGPK